MKMSAMKTQTYYDVVHGDDLVFTSDGISKTMKVTSMVLDRDVLRQDVCKIVARMENQGSLPTSEMKVVDCRIDNCKHEKSHLTYSLTTLLPSEREPRHLDLKVVKSNNQTSCIIS